MDSKRCMFSETEKAEGFDKIASRFYDKNFGQMSKADIEVLMFSIYIEHCLKNKISIDDYDIAVDLGIPESRIRGLKIKKELQYPYPEFYWKQVFAECIKDAKYDDKKALIKVSIHDPNVRRCVEHELDQLHLYSEHQLNSKLLQLRPDAFIELCQSIEGKNYDGKEYRQKLEDELRNSASGRLLEKEESLLSRIGTDTLSSLAPDIVKAFGKMGIKAILEIIPFGSLLSPFVEAFISNL